MSEMREKDQAMKVLLPLKLYTVYLATEMLFHRFIEFYKLISV